MGNPSSAARSTAVLVDTLIVFCLGTIAVIAITGGGIFRIGTIHVSARSVGNPLIALYALATVRLFLMRALPLFGFSHFSLEDVTDNSAAVVLRIRRRLNALDDTAIARALMAIAGISIILRSINTIGHPGFFSGDDVEVHEMTFRRLFGYQWPIWELRNAFYPLVFVFPAQAVAAQLGVLKTDTLIAIGRIVVLTLSSLSIWLVYRIASHLRDRATAILAAVLFASSRLHIWFGSSELPRPVASVFILAAFLILQRSGDRRSALAGTLLGIGGSLRFGELIYFVPAAVHLALDRRWRELALVGSSGSAAALLVVGISDALYWGTPFSSAWHIVNYTVLTAQSSRGFQPAWYYLVSATDWTNYAVLGLSLYALFVLKNRPALWGWLPIAMLSALPHKEARYVIAAQPLLCIAAATAFWHVLEFDGSKGKGRLWRFVAIAAVVGAIAFELGNWRFRRDDASVRMAQQIARERPSIVLAEQSWRLGGHLYLSDAQLVDVLPEDALRATREYRPDWVLLLKQTDPATLQELSSLGYRIIEDRWGTPYIVLRNSRTETASSRGTNGETHSPVP